MFQGLKRIKNGYNMTPGLKAINSVRVKIESDLFICVYIITKNNDQHEGDA